MRHSSPPSTYAEGSPGLMITGHFQVDETYATNRPNGREDWLITYTLSGSGTFTTPDSSRPCTQGDVVIVKPGTPHRYGTSSGDHWNFIWAHFSSRSIGDQLLPVEPLYVQPLEPGSVQTRVYEAFLRLLTDSRERHEYWQDLCLNALREILLLLAYRRNRTLDPRISEALHYLSVHMRSPIQIDTLAKVIGLSASRLSHLFKEQMGVTIIDALNQMRIHQACLLLEHTNRSASEIAYEVGFYNYNHFINQFRKWTGTVPSRFNRNKH